MEVWAAIVIGPVLLAAINGWQTRRAKKQDWVRQDEVARRVEVAAMELLEKQTETAKKAAQAADLLLENNKVVAETAEVTNTKLDEIHTLVNSNMTKVLQSELAMARHNLITLNELIRVRKGQGENPSEDTLAEKLALEEKIQELDANLVDRLEQTKLASAQVFIARETKVKKADDEP